MESREQSKHSNQVQATESHVADRERSKQPWWHIFPVISKEGAVHLKQHKYSGSDLGFAYRFFYNPVATKIVECLPDWLAPNTLTLLGFLHTLVPLTILWVVCGTEFFGDVPNWFCFFQAYCYFAYRMFDEMDGLIFDHGCDCFSLGFQGLMSLRILQIGNNPLAMCILITLYGAFHFATLEEYYVGTLRLPPGNGVSDGSIAIIILFIVTGFTGNDIWAKHVCSGSWLGIQAIETLTVGQLFMLIVGVTQIISYFANWIRILWSRKHPYETQAEEVHRGWLTFQILSFFFWNFVWYAYAFLGTEETRILSKPIQVSQDMDENDYGNFGQGYFLIYMVLYVFIMTHQTISIQLCHVSLQIYNPFTKMLAFTVCSIVITALITAASESGSVNVRLSVVILTVLVFLFQWSMILKVIREITAILDICVFTTHQSRARKALRKESKPLGRESSEGKQQSNGPFVGRSSTASSGVSAIETSPHADIELGRVKPADKVADAENLEKAGDQLGLPSPQHQLGPNESEANINDSHPEGHVGAVIRDSPMKPSK